MKIQNYNEGEINKTSDGQYEYVVGGKVKGTYPSVAYLVNAYPEVGANETRKNTGNAEPTTSTQKAPAKKRSRKS